MDVVCVPAGSSFVVFTAEERPDLWVETEASFPQVWPEYNLHGDVMERYFGALFPERAHTQLLVVDADVGGVVARAKSIPLPWDGTLDDLPSGIDAAGLRAVEDRRPPTALTALDAEVAPEHRGRGLSGVLLQGLAEVARRAGLAHLIAPVRPTWKDRYPLIPIGRYAQWRRADGLPFDPWIRVHVRLGAEILRPAPRSLAITASVAEWEQWTGLAYPDDGEYVFPAGLAPLAVSGGIGRYWEPNVWMRHPLG